MRMLAFVAVADIGSSSEIFGYHRSSRMLTTLSSAQGCSNFKCSRTSSGHFLSAQNRSNFKGSPDSRRFGSLSVLFGDFGSFWRFWRFWQILAISAILTVFGDFGDLSGISGLGESKLRRHVQAHLIVLTSRCSRTLVEIF